MNGCLFSLDRGSGSQIVRMVLCLIALLFCTPGLRATTLEEIPVRHWVYPLIDHLQKRGHFGDLFFANRPYTRGEVAKYCIDLMKERDAGALDRFEVFWLERLEREFGREISRLSDPEAVDANAFIYRIELAGMPRVDLKEDDAELEPAYESIKFGGSVDPDLYLRAGVGASLQYREHIAVVPRFEVNSNPVNDPDYRLRNSEVRGRHLNIPHAYMSGRLGPVGIVFGRSNIVWGSGGPGSLTVSPVSPAFDLFKYNVEVRTFRASGFLAFLDKRPLEDSSINRYLYGHRIDWRATPWLQLGFSESALVTGVGRGIEFSYLNPLIPYQLLQKEEGEEQTDTDTYASVDGSIFLADRFFFTGELLIDDTFLFRMESNEDFPVQVAVDLGVEWTGDPMPSGTVVSASYTRIGSFVYLHRGTATDYSHYDAPIGHVIGPDSDRWEIGVSAQLYRNLGIGVDYRQRRRGENRLEPALSAEGHRDEPFPSGVVEKRKGVGMSLDWFATDDLRIQGDFVYTSVRNLNNEEGREDTIASLELSVGYQFDYGGSFE